MIITYHNIHIYVEIIYCLNFTINIKNTNNNIFKISNTINAVYLEAVSSLNF